MISLSLSIHPDGSLRLRQTKFTWPGQRLIEAIPEKEWTGSDWKFPVSALADVYAKVAGAGKLDMDPAVKAALNDVRRAQAVSQVVPDITDYQFKTTPFNHQKIAFNLARKRTEFAFLMEMGTGKTKAMIDTVSYHLQLNRIDFCLVLAPKAVLLNWEREIAVHCPLPPDKRRAVVLTGNTKRQALEQASNSAHFIITNYETLLSLGPELRALFVRRRGGICLDEATEIKNPKSKTAKAAEELGLVAKLRYIATGSPVTQSPLDAYMQFRFLHKNILGHHTFTSFKAEYAVSKRMVNIPVPIVVAYRNLDRLNKLIQPYSYRVLKADCLDLPDKVYRRVDLQMGTNQQAFYRQMEEDAVIMEGEEAVLSAPLVLTKLMRLQQIASGFFPIVNEFGEEVSSKTIDDAPKLDAVIELVKEAVASQQKVLVWCRFLWEVHNIERLLTEEKLEVVSYYGDKTAAERQAAVDSIQTGTTQVFIGQIQTGGMGITLTAASTVIYYSNSFSLAERLQSEDRAHRIGQKRSVTYIDLVVRGTVDQLVLKALKDKKNLADIVTGDNLKRLLEASYE